MTKVNLVLPMDACKMTFVASEKPAEKWTKLDCDNFSENLPRAETAVVLSRPSQIQNASKPKFEVETNEIECTVEIPNDVNAKKLVAGDVTQNQCLSPEACCGQKLMEHACKTFADIDYVVLKGLLLGPTNANHFLQLYPIGELSLGMFESPLHLLGCLIKYRPIFAFKREFEQVQQVPQSWSKYYQEFIENVLQKLQKGCRMAEISPTVLDIMIRSSKDPYFDFSQVSLSELDSEKIANVFAPYDITDEEDPSFTKVIECFISGLSPSELSILLTRKSFIDQFQTSNKFTVIKAIVAQVAKFCEKSRNIWEDDDFWRMLEMICNSNIPNLVDGILLGVRAPNYHVAGVMHSLAKVGASLSERMLPKIISTLAKLSKTDSRHMSTSVASPDILLCALRNAAYPLVSFLTKFLNMAVSRKMANGNNCPWALLQTAHSGTWELFENFLDDADVNCIYDGLGESETDELVGIYIQGVYEGDGWFNSAFLLPGWKIKPSTTSVIFASIGNLAVFQRLIESIDLRDIWQHTCSLETSWENERWTEHKSVGLFDFALLSGFVLEAKIILEKLIESRGRGFCGPIYHAPFLLQWLQWMTRNIDAPLPPSRYSGPSAEPSVHSKTIKSIMSLLTDDIEDLIESNWPQALPFDLYARDWISQDHMRRFMDSDRFDACCERTAASSFLCWAAWRFDVLLIANYVQLVLADRRQQRRQRALLRARTALNGSASGGESWLHLLARGFVEAPSPDLSFLHIALRTIDDSNVFSAVDGSGNSVADVWELVLRKAPKEHLAEAKRILTIIQSKRCKLQFALNTD
ncbi:hypothetical protein HDU82_001703 [Entophlyctis luteolus]|nr:hypothetical protein HDU82_001703 [Entophlyctis luteolus]